MGHGKDIDVAVGPAQKVALLPKGMEDTPVACGKEEKGQRQKM
jgi:hypothetical protein